MPTQGVNNKKNNKFLSEILHNPIQPSVVLNILVHSLYTILQDFKIQKILISELSSILITVNCLFPTYIFIICVNLLQLLSPNEDSSNSAF
jgi:hypothetical protein